MNKPMTVERKVGHHNISVRSYSWSGKGVKGIYVYLNGAKLCDALTQYGGKISEVNARIPAYLDSLTVVSIGELIMKQMDQNQEAIHEVRSTLRELKGEQKILKDALLGNEPLVECKKFVSSGRRGAVSEFNEGDEHLICTCGEPLGLHKDKVVKAAGFKF